MHTLPPDTPRALVYAYDLWCMVNDTKPTAATLDAFRAGWRAHEARRAADAVPPRTDAAGVTLAAGPASRLLGRAFLAVVGLAGLAWLLLYFAGRV